MGQGWEGEDYGMQQGMGWGKNRDPEPSLLLDLLSLVPMEEFPHASHRTGSGLAPPSPQGEAAQACTGWFIYKYTDVSSFVGVSIFCFCGKRQKVSVEGRVGVVMW